MSASTHKSCAARNKFRKMQARVLGTWLFSFAFIVNSFGQRIVDQWSIEPADSVFLFDTMSVEGFLPQVAIGTAFPDFQTVTTENEVLSRDLILSECVTESKVPIVVFGRPSCNFMRAAYRELVLPMLDEMSQSVKLYHIANSIEVHPTNEYVSPYFTIEDGITYSGDILVPDNIGYEFLQPFTGQELIDLSSDFANKMAETGTGEEDDYEETIILLDNLQGGFTESFAGPAILWVINPFTKQVVYERTDFSCYLDEGSSSCQSEYDEFLSAIESMRNTFNPVGVDDNAFNTSAWIRIEVNLLGQQQNQSSLLYNPKTKQKRITPAK